MPTAELNGVQVDSHTGTDADLAAALSIPSDGPAEQVAAKPAEAVEKKPAAAEAEPDPASEAGKQLAGKRKSMQDRIDQVTWEKHEAARRAEKAEQELAALKNPQTAKPAEDGRPKLKAFTEQIGSTYETYEDAVDAHANALADYKLAARDTASVTEQRTHARQQALDATRAKGQEAHADFDAVLDAFVQQGGRFAPGSPAEAQGPLGDLESVILQHPLGHSVAYEVAKDADLRQRLMSAPSHVMFMAEMGELLTRLKTAPTGSVVKAAPVSKATPPPSRVVGQPKAHDGPPGDDASDEDYRVWANSQDLSRRRRA